MNATFVESAQAPSYQVIDASKVNPGEGYIGENGTVRVVLDSDTYVMFPSDRPSVYKVYSMDKWPKRTVLRKVKGELTLSL